MHEAMVIVDGVVALGVDGCVVEISAVIESNKNYASDKNSNIVF